MHWNRLPNRRNHIPRKNHTTRLVIHTINANNNHRHDTRLPIHKEAKNITPEQAYTLTWFIIGFTISVPMSIALIIIYKMWRNLKSQT